MGWIRDRLRGELRGALRAELDAARETVRRELGEQRVALDNRIERISGVLDRMCEQLEADRTAQRALLQSMLRDVVHELRSASGPRSLARPGVIAGSIEATAAGVGNRVPVDIDLTDPIPSGTLVAARSHFSETWYDGFEVTEVIREPAGSRYRLVRRRDGRTLPMLYGSADIRPSAAGAPARAPSTDLPPAGPSSVDD